MSTDRQKLVDLLTEFGVKFKVNVSTYGDTLAKALAIQHRKIMLDKLNKDGDEYTSRHGVKEEIHA